MVESICIFEGLYYNRLLPLVYLRPVYDLRCGILTLRTKIEKAYPGIPVSLHCRNYMADYVKLRHPTYSVNEINGNSCLFVNGRVIAGTDFAEKVPPEGGDTLYVNGDTVIAARVSGQKLREIKKMMVDILTVGDFTGLITQEIDVKVISYPWDLVQNNESELRTDFKTLINTTPSAKANKVYDGAYLLNRENIYIGENTVVYPTAVLDAEEGPIFIGKNAKIFPNVTIIGPAFIGDESQIKIGAKLYHGSNIGRVCKVGGEVENSVIHSFSNKQHDGFLGNSYIGSWANLGAGTNNSDLKNNYGSIKVTINNEVVDSGSQFVGLTLGDHSKSAISTTFNTGSVIGVCCNVYGAGFPPKYIPSFAWGGADALTTYDLERSLEVAERVMERRHIQLTPADKKMFRKVFDLTRDERRKRGMPN
ncbi:MAG: hypothetical protein K9G57_00980 [Ignavibacteriales bacterium]|nr:hypothetical protein [Ignavibacteriales bacterium]